MDSKVINFGSCLAMIALLVLAGACYGEEPGLTRDDHSGDASARTRLHVTVLRDVSPSMKSRGRHETAGEVLALAGNLLDGHMTIVEFATDARVVSQTDALRRPKVPESDDMVALGSATSYVAALRKIPAATTAAILISDGQPSEKPEQVLEFLKQYATTPLHTIAIDADAEDLLRQMAAETGGGHHRADDARSLVDAFLTILSQVASFRLLESAGTPLMVEDTDGEVICIGIGAEPRVEDSGSRHHDDSLENNTARSVYHLPGRDVHVLRQHTDAPGPLRVYLDGPAANGKELIVVSRNVPSIDVELRRTRQGELLARARLPRRASGQGVETIQTRFTVTAEDGQQVVAIGRNNGELSEAEISVPSGPFNLQVESIDREAGRQVVTRAVSEIDSLPDATPDLALSANMSATSTTCGDPITIEVLMRPANPTEYANWDRILSDYLPHLSVKHPDGRVFDSDQYASRFRRSSPKVENSVATYSINYQEPDAPGDYCILLDAARGGSGLRHPEAETHVDVYGFSDSSLDLKIVTHRNTGKVVLGQSGQNITRAGLAGFDRVSVELVCGSLDRRVFAALGNRIHAKWLCEDGSVQRANLRLNGDRYTTDPVLASWQGKVTCRFQLGETGTTSVLEATATFLPVRFELNTELTESLPREVPEGTEARFHLHVDARVAERLATPEEMVELISVERPFVGLTFENRTGSVVRRLQHDACESQSVEFVVDLEPVGQYRLAATLEGRTSEKTWDQVKWPEIRVKPSPIAISLCQQLTDGRYSPVDPERCPSWVPNFLRKSPANLWHVVRLKTGLDSPHFIESVSFGDQVAEFVPEDNCFVLPARDTCGNECAVTLRTLGPSGITVGSGVFLVKKHDVLKDAESINYGRSAIILGLMGVIPAIVVAGRRLSAARRTQRHHSEVFLATDSNIDIRPLVPQDQFWPTTEILLCRTDGTYQLAYPGQAPSGAAVVARARQVPDGRVYFRAHEDLFDMPAGEVVLLDAGASDVRIDHTTSVSVSLGEDNWHYADPLTR